MVVPKLLFSKKWSSLFTHLTAMLSSSAQHGHLYIKQFEQTNNHQCTVIILVMNEYVKVKAI